MPNLKFQAFRVDIDPTLHPALRHNRAIYHWYTCVRCNKTVLLDPYEGEIWCSNCDILYKPED